MLSIAIDQNNNIYVGGVAGNNGFPTTANGYSRTNNDAGGGYIAQLNNNLNTLLKSTLLRGSVMNIYLYNNTIVTVNGGGNYPVIQQAYSTTPNSFQE